MKTHRWREIRQGPPLSVYDKVLLVGGVIEEARDLEFADEWPNHVRDWLLARNPTLRADDIGYTEVLEALRALEYIP